MIQWLTLITWLCINLAPLPDSSLRPHRTLALCCKRWTKFLASARDKLLLIIPCFLKRGLYLPSARRDQSLNGYAELRRKHVRDVLANDEHCSGLFLFSGAAERQTWAETVGDQRPQRIPLKFSLWDVFWCRRQILERTTDRLHSEMTCPDPEMQDGCESR